MNMEFPKFAAIVSQLETDSTMLKEEAKIANEKTKPHVEALLENF